MPEGEIKIEDLQAEIEKYKSIKSEAFKERDEYKGKVKELTEQLENITKQKQEEQGKYKELYEETETKFSATQKELVEAMKYKETAEAIEKERRQELIERLEDDALKNVANKINDLPTLKDFVSVSLEKLLKTKMPDGKAGKTAIDPNKTWDDYTFNQLEDLAVSNPDAYNKLAREKYKKKI
jgi:chromosome segregation ATPase